MMRFFGISFSFQGREEGEIIVSKNEIAPDAASSFPRLLAGWRPAQKPPKLSHSASHTWFSLIFTFRSKNKAYSRWKHSQSRTKGQPAEVPPGEGILLPLAGPSTQRHPALNLGTHPFPKHAEKPAHISGTSQTPSRQAGSLQHPHPTPALTHRLGRTFREELGEGPAPSHSFLLFLSLQLVILKKMRVFWGFFSGFFRNYFQEKRERQPNLWSWAKANENREIAQEEPHRAAPVPACSHP